MTSSFEDLMIYLAVFSTSILWLYLFKKISSVKGWATLIQAFLTGSISAPIAGLLTGFFVNLQELNLQGNTSAFYLHFFLVGPIEELVKISACALVISRTQTYGSKNQLILTGVSTALGFAGIENLIYLNNFGFTLTWPRMILGNLGHSGYAVLWSYAFAVCFLDQVGIRFLVGASIYAALLHGAYNFLLTFNALGAIVAFSITLLLAVFIVFLLRLEKSNRVN